MLPDASLGSAIFDRCELLIDVGILVVFLIIHAASWQSGDSNAGSNYKKEAQDGVRAAAAAGLTVAGILIPLSILTIGLTAGEKVELPTIVLVDFFVANVWLVISLLLGLYVLYFVGLHGYKQNILTFKATGVVYGMQLAFLAVGTIRLVWGMASLVDSLI